MGGNYTGLLSVVGQYSRDENMLRQTLVTVEVEEGVITEVSSGGEFQVDLIPVDRPGIGPGSNLMRMLKTVGVDFRPGCQCLAISSDMDAAGPGAVRENADAYAKRIAEEAKARQWPIVFGAAQWSAKQLILIAVRQSEVALTQPKIDRDDLLRRLETLERTVAYLQRNEVA